MTRWFRRNPIIVLGLGIVIGLLSAVTVQLSGVFTNSAPQAQLSMPEFPLHAASGGHGGEGFAIATGTLDEDGDCLFTIDYLTGDLMCWVPHPATGKFTMLYKANVMSDLGVEKGKKPNFAMSTGLLSWRGAVGGGVRYGNSVVYVADCNTGKFVSYGIAFPPEARLGAMFPGTLTKVAVGQGRNVPQR